MTFYQELQLSSAYFKTVDQKYDRQKRKMASYSYL